MQLDVIAHTAPPSQATQVVQAWKHDLESKKRSKIAISLADPSDDSDLFDNWEAALRQESEGAVSESNGVETDSHRSDNAAEMVAKLRNGSVTLHEAENHSGNGRVKVDASESIPITNGKTPSVGQDTLDAEEHDGDAEGEATLA